MQVCGGVHVCALVSVGSHPLSLAAYSLPEPKVYIFSISLDTGKPQPPPVSVHLRAVISGEY